MEIVDFEALLTPPGQEVLAAAMASDTTESALLTTASRLRAGHSASLVNAALTQVRLRVRAAAKFGQDAAGMYFTPAGLEQSTRASVAVHRAERFASFPNFSHDRILEVCCGIGADLLFRARAGVPGDAVDLDPLTVAVAQANLAAFPDCSVRLGDALEQDPRGYSALFADPGRRTARGRVFDPRAYEPPLDSLLALAARAPAACVKVAPGLPYEAIPEGAEVEWISDGGEVKEAALWLGGLSGHTPGGEPFLRRATLLGRSGTHTLTAQGLPDPAVRGWGRFLYEPDGAAIRAHLVAEVAASVGGGLADPRIAYITGDELVATPFAAAYEIHEVLPFSVKRLKALLRAHDIGILTLKKRGFAADLDRLRRDLRPSGTQTATVVLTRVGDDPVAIFSSPMKAKS